MNTSDTMIDEVVTTTLQQWKQMENLHAPFIPLYWWQEHRANFGDLLSADVVMRISGRGVRWTNASPKLLAIGSIIQFANANDIVWGSGVHHKFLNRPTPQINVAAVRGPLTRNFLKAGGIDCPKVYGDPAILLPILTGEEPHPNGSTGVIIHYADKRRYADVNTIDVEANWHTVLSQILDCSKIISSSLHGIIVAEAFGIPAVWLKSRSERRLKYDDYYRSTGRRINPAKSLEDAMRVDPPPLPVLDRMRDDLLFSFPLSAAKRSSRTKSTTVIFGIHTRGYREIFAGCIKTQQFYCQKHGYDYHAFEVDWPPAICCWVRHAVIQRLLSRYEHVLSVDADVLIRSHAPAIETMIVPEKHIYLAPGWTNRVNAGVIIAKQHNNTIEFFDRFVRTCEHTSLSSDWGDNGHLIDFVAQNPHHVQLIDSKWNNSVALDSDSYFQHFTGPLGKTVRSSKSAYRSKVTYDYITGLAEELLCCQV